MRCGAAMTAGDLSRGVIGWLMGVHMWRTQRLESHMCRQVMRGDFGAQPGAPSDWVTVSMSWARLAP